MGRKSMMIASRFISDTDRLLEDQTSSDRFS